MGPGNIIAGRFRIERLAGAGGMGAVYQALDSLNGQRVALKVLTSLGATAAERFLREGALLAEFAHPGIVRYVAHGTTDDGERYLAMEWLEGHDLAHRLDRGPLSLPETVAVIARIARALSVLHARDVVHRDIKPSNIFLVGGSIEAAKLLDFGIARHAPEGARVTRTGAALGTPGYMPPEQVRGDKVLDARSDIFSLGCVLFECLTGQPPFGGEHAIAILARIILEPAPVPSARCPWLPAAMDELVLRMLAKAPKDRPETVDAIADELQRLAESTEDVPAPVSKAVPSLRAITESEQRMITVVLGGSSGGHSTMMADEVAEMERGLDEVAEMRGAAFETLADGSILVAFSEEGAATDRAARAARTALRIRELFPSMSLAIATGKMLVSHAGASNASMGDAVDRAAHALASARGIALDLTTAQLLDARFEVAGESDTLELIGETSLGDETRTVLGKKTACVGRERELSILSGILEECASDAAARAALVIGPPGSGKSRIRQEFLKRVERRDDAVTVWLARADLLGKGSPFAVVARAIRGAAGMFDGEPLVVRRAKLAAKVAEHVQEAERQRVTEFLAELVGAPFSEEPSVRIRAARTDAILMGDEMRRAFEDLIAAECGDVPLLLVLEDLHWGDRPTVLWVDALLRNLHDKPLMVLALARPEVNELFPKLWSERSITEINVSPLSRKAAEKLARDVLGPNADEKTIARVVDRASGNAFYLEELLRVARDGDEAELPETVLAMVHARLSSLDPDARIVLRAASVFGQVFWKSGLEALLGREHARDLDVWLDVLSTREFIERRSNAKFPGEEEFAFRHALVRDAAYSMLTDEDVRTGHRQAAPWLEGAGERDAMVLAEHFELGGKHGRAIEHICRAAEQALEGNDFDAVFARVDRGKLLGAEGEMLGKLFVLDAEARMWIGDHARMESAAKEALLRLPEGSASWYSALSSLAFAYSRLTLVTPAKELAARLRGARRKEGAESAFVMALCRLSTILRKAGELSLAEEVEDEGFALAESTVLDARTLGFLHYQRAVSRFVTSMSSTMEDLQLGIDCFVEAGDLRRACVAREVAGYAMTELGQFSAAEAYLRGTLSESQRLGLSTMSARENLGRVLAMAGEADEALALLEATEKDARLTGDKRREGVCRCYAALLLLRRGEIDRADSKAEQALTLLESVSGPRAFTLGVMAGIRLAQGRTTEGLAAAREANAERDALGGTLHEGDALVRLSLAETLRACGQTQAAREVIDAAEQRLLERAQRIQNLAWRTTFLEQVEENRRTLSLAREWRP